MSRLIKPRQTVERFRTAESGLFHGSDRSKLTRLAGWGVLAPTSC